MANIDLESLYDINNSIANIETLALDINAQVNGTTQQYFGPLQYFGRCKGCNNNLASSNPASIYQKNKIIWKTVRVPSSLYTTNIGALNVYQKPENKYQVIENGSTYIASPGVNWNQMSDRKQPHIQKVVSASGLTGNSLKRSITRQRPGALSPGGIGVDIKHNSYHRYLARLTGKGPLRRGYIPPTLNPSYIRFNPAFPIYGGKVFKTSIVNNCNCPIESPNYAYKYSNTQDEIYNVKYKFTVGDIILVDSSKIAESKFKAKIIELLEGNRLLVSSLVDNNTYTILDTEARIFLLQRCIDIPCKKIDVNLINYSSINYLNKKLNIDLFNYGLANDLP